MPKSSVQREDEVELIDLAPAPAAPGNQTDALVNLASETTKGGFMSYVMRFFSTKALSAYFGTTLWHWFAFPIVWLFETLGFVIESINFFHDKHKSTSKVLNWLSSLVKYLAISAAVLITVLVAAAAITVAAPVVGSLFAGALGIKSLFHLGMAIKTTVDYFRMPTPTTKLEAHRKRQAAAVPLEHLYAGGVSAGLAVIVVFALVLTKGAAAIAGSAVAAASTIGGGFIFWGNHKAAKTDGKLQLEEELKKTAPSSEEESLASRQKEKKAASLGADNSSDNSQKDDINENEWLLPFAINPKASPLTPKNVAPDAQQFATVLAKARDNKNRLLWDATKERIVDYVLAGKDTREQRDRTNIYKAILRAHFDHTDKGFGSWACRFFKDGETSSWRKVKHLLEEKKEFAIDTAATHDHIRTRYQ